MPAPTKRSYSRVNRRNVLRGLGMAGVVGVAGCLGDDPDDSDDPTPTPDDSGEETPTPDPTREPFGTYISAAGSEARALNLYRINDTTSGAVANLVLDGAYTFDTEDNYAFRWVESIDTDDNQTYEFKLRDNLYWSDPYGQMTAEDWVFYVENVATEENNWTGHVSRGDWIIGDEPVVAEQVDELTFTLELPAPDPAYPGRPAMWGEQILPKALTEPYFEDYLDGNEDAGDELDEDEVVQQFQYTGNLGPYKFVERRIEDRVIFERNDEYYMREHGGDAWVNAPYFDDRVIRVLEEESTRLAELEAGGLTAASIPADDAERFEEMDHINVVQNANQYCSILAYNQRRNGWEALRTKEVRHAISSAINKEVISNDIYQGYADPAQTFHPFWGAFYDDSEVVEFGVGDSYDVDHARQLLEDNLPAEYGYDGDELVGPDGQVELTIVFSSASDNVEDAGRYMGTELEALGIELNLDAVPFNTMIDRYIMQVDDDGNPAGFNSGDRDGYVSELQWDLMWGIGFNTYPRTPEAIATFWTHDGGTNYYGYEPSADIGDMLEAAAGAEEADEQQSLYAEVFGILSDDQPVNFVQFGQDIDGYQQEVVHTESPSLEGTGFGYQSQTWYFSEEP